MAGEKAKKADEIAAGGGGAMERAFDSWLEHSFLPPALAACKKKKLTGANKGKSEGK